MANSTKRQTGRNCNSFVIKKRAKKVGEREVGQCSKGNCFLGLDVDIALVGSPDGRQTARAALNIAKNKIINKNNKIPCI